MNLIIYSVIIAFLLSIIQGPLLIPLLHKLKFGQNIRAEGPKSHLKKAGTPTMGGIIFMVSTIITMLLIVRHTNNEVMIALYCFIAFGLIGLIDDFLKITHKDNEGLKSKQKMLLIVIVAGVIGYYSSIRLGTDIMIPFTNISVNLGIWYVPFIIIYFASTTNAVNLTDGLDGLATSVTIIVMTFFALVSNMLFHPSLAIFCAALAGALLGFLKYNFYKAQIFMGDMGSLALGGAVAGVGMILKSPFLVVIVGGIYVMETLSVIIQVFVFKATGKRVFKMSPIHHHFELSGWNETKVVAVFSIATVVFCLIGFLSFSY
ncbi:phospho-N-acetylmuramoyl-pentapeptide-transferase [Clostridium estertheticum]|uniref:phospho-N-acetylmuramoyl-pentapeptide- transferase n=1 Tax=Clostridium estertheticum TaxID=238834 RepID=UPI001CF56F54|nr:phospho-N-acetylmuramoyl-pentapeptide-transferase [Clostridium estertheticum]MCB2308080.1 phospho-N-acetylmuramoyl-pentapeptide-transferase [Clostridium estertheticum]MCB2346204.1 phospho-N-acetylmuramoyl-pentapeptide-transferase [Clostridium estertheticum]MCB2351378.1 phospho-N-acetylmuramoyl-pentapeptide-transferase [Clostridium estertheticum]WAG44546.1 phospho-N-acetylmuramoyl-pentapeptide-transferase [Clostridium estertheticum]